MALPRLSALLVPFVGLVLAGCPYAGDGPTTTIVTGGATTGITTNDLEGGFEGGPEQDCFGYLEACEQDPYCVCYGLCFGEGALQSSECLAACGLAELPYWFKAFEDCIGSPVEPEPEPEPPPNLTSGSSDGGDSTEGGDPSDTSG